MSEQPPYYQDEQVTLLLGDALEQLRTLPDGSVDCIVTSPPYYGLRSYGIDGQYGLEATLPEYVATMRAVFTEARRVLTDDGTLWLNLGDSYSAGGQGGNRGGRLIGGAHLDRVPGRTRVPGFAPKNLLMIPARVAMALQDDGWVLRNEIAWHKINAKPEPVRDRMSSRHEKLYLLTKSQRYAFNLDAVREPYTCPNDSRLNPEQVARGRNPGDVWAIPTGSYPGAHEAVFPIDLPLRCIRAGCRPGGTVLDLFSGSGTTGAAAVQLGCQYVGIDLNAAYHDLARERFTQGVLAFDTP
ncbi:MAG TPA: site-specific DNA-methyltransferase [Kofleriaceae bacterium]|nr:site-specific DNA-methyltransferase [Kofleriaceae bacterium]